jgi:hypothetical protein
VKERTVPKAKKMEFHYSLDKKSSMHFFPFEKLRREWNPEIPDFQRAHQEARVDHFVRILVHHFSTEGFVYNLNPIQLGRVGDKYFILDGQHRFLAYSKLAREYDLEDACEFCVSVVVRNCTSQEELKHHFAVLNDHFLTPDLEVGSVEAIDKSVAVKNFVRDSFGKYLSHATSPKFPNVNLDSFAAFLLKRFDGSVEKFRDANRVVGEYLRTNEPERFHKIAVKNPADPLFFTHVYHLQKSGTPRVQLPASVRRGLWDAKFGLSNLSGLCFVCKCAIDFHSFHVGHVVAVAKGGTNALSNLECVCISCNLSMGTENLLDFKQKFFEDV